MRCAAGNLVLVVICMLALTACAIRLAATPLRGTQPVVKIGLVAPFEGFDRPLGYEALAGVKLALAERNAGGGVGGYLVELVALNDLGEPNEARGQARELAVDPAVMGVVTGWTAQTARASLPVFRQAGLPVAVPWSAPSELADAAAGLVLVAADAEQVAQPLAEAVVAMQPDRLVVVGDEFSAAPYAQALGALGMEATIRPPPNTVEGPGSEEWAMRLVLSRVRPPDTLVLATDGDVAGQVLLALARLGWKGPVFGGVDVGSIHVVSVAGDAATGMAFVSPAPAGRHVAQAEGVLPSRRDELGPRAVLAYDATQVLLDALELAVRRDGYPSRAGLIATLPGVQRRGLTGAIAFDATGRRIDAPVWLYRMAHLNYPGQVLLSPQAVSGK
jgi:branched-chain amino acid transport system substrate-binding protein